MVFCWWLNYNGAIRRTKPQPLPVGPCVSGRQWNRRQRRATCNIFFPGYDIKQNEDGLFLQAAMAASSFHKHVLLSEPTLPDKLHHKLQTAPTKEVSLEVRKVLRYPRTKNEVKHLMGYTSKVPPKIPSKTVEHLMGST